MKNRKSITFLLLAATALPVAGLVLASKSPARAQAEKVARGK